MTSLPDDLVSAKEAAAAVGVSHWCMLRWLRNGFIPGYRLGMGRYRVSLAEALRVGLRPIEPASADDAPRTLAQERAAAEAATARLKERGYGRGKG